MVTILIFVFAIAAIPSLSLIIIGVPIVSAGTALRVWATGYLNRNIQLSTDGPYGYCRNPLYLGTALEWIGILIMTGQLIIWLLGIFCFAVLYVPTIRQEERILTQLFGPEYEHYCQSVPRLIPKLRPTYSPIRVGFSWHQVQMNREYINLAGVLAVVILIVLQLW